MQNMLQAGMIIAGWDEHEGGAVYALPLGGTLLKVPFSIGVLHVLATLLASACLMIISGPDSKCNGQGGP